jgi:membrane associated rhomboid family serine protease
MAGVAKTLITSTSPSIELTHHARVLFGFIGAMWVIWIFDQATDGSLKKEFSIYPQTDKGLKGILFAPLLHDDFGHLVSNSSVLAVLGGLLMLWQIEYFFIVTFVAWLISGLGIWLLASPKSHHFGASGIGFGYVGFFLLRGYFERSAGAIAFAVLTAMMYGSILLGLLPIQANEAKKASWHGHFFGFLGGVLAAKFLPELQLWFRALF